MSASLPKPPNDISNLADADIPASPCNKICVLNSSGAMCIGCFRTLDEIAAWGAFSTNEKYTVLSLLPARRAAYTSP